jgi:hypothetical protein
VYILLPKCVLYETLHSKNFALSYLPKSNKIICIPLSSCDTIKIIYMKMLSTWTFIFIYVALSLTNIALGVICAGSHFCQEPGLR